MPFPDINKSHYDEVFKSLMSIHLGVASSEANNPAQQSFDFLDRAYPVLDLAFRDDGFDFQRWLSEHEFKDEELEDAAMIAKISYALAMRMEKILSPASFRGQRVVLPLNYLKRMKVLGGLNILDISTDDRASRELSRLGAETALLSPYTLIKKSESEQFSASERNRMTSVLEKEITEITRQGIHDLVFVDRNTLFWALASDVEVEGELFEECKRIKRIIRAVFKDFYSKAKTIAPLTPGTAPLCEVFVKKPSRSRQRKNSPMTG